MLAEWVGGPWDGQEVELPDCAQKIAVSRQLTPGLLELVLPITHTQDGARIYWHEPE